MHIVDDTDCVRRNIFSLFERVSKLVYLVLEISKCSTRKSWNGPEEVYKPRYLVHKAMNIHK